MDSKLLLITAFITGTVLMALEMIGARMLAPYFGNSIYVWGNLIGVILIALSIGYYLGGKLADKQKDAKMLYYIILGTALYILATLFFYKPFLESLDVGLFYGSILATFTLFALPMFLLSTVTPYIIKLIAKRDKIGTTVGSVTAISTIGNIIGVYLGSFVLIPSIGVRLSLQVLFLALLAISIIALSTIRRKYIALALLAFILLFTPTYAADKEIIYEDDSLYNHIVVKNSTNELRLFLNKQTNVHSTRHHELFISGRYYDYFLFLPLMTEVENFLILGMGAGTSIDQYQIYYPEIDIDAVEIDEKVVQVAKDYFGIQENKKLSIFVEDARPFLKRTKKTYDAIEIDLFQGSIYTPFYTTTKEFFTLVQDVLSEKGIIAVNVYSPKDRGLIDAMEQTMLEIFPEVFEIDLSPNYIVFAGKKIGTDISSPIVEIQRVIERRPIEKVEKITSAMILTDDHAPVEFLTGTN
ncbi:hypothetical protein GOV09_05220 [Candidatus Woesearchaeota archaeon]|nr:hypothetical protein [Candidatus Woesearchaeota archaeon]